MTLPNGVSAAYSYDVAGRLTGMKYSKGSQVLRDLAYSYDEINRRTAYSGNTAPEPKDTATDTVTVNALNQYTTRNGKPVSHDDNGNQTKNNAVWDARDRLVSLSGPNFTASFTYDAMGRRTSKTVNGQTKTYLYDGSDLISETGADYTFGPGIDQPLERKSGQNEYYLSDALGSVIGLADGTGALKTSYNYSPFGKKQTTGVNSSNPFAFTGREDDGNGYYYYRARYYNPDQKRFIAEDPLGFGGGDTNLYGYVGNKPIDRIDPLGLEADSYSLEGSYGLGAGSSGSVSLNTDDKGNVSISISIGGGLYYGAGASLTGGYAHYPNCKTTVDDLNGHSNSIGGSGGLLEGPVGGFSFTNISDHGDRSNMGRNYSGGVGIGSPEAHVVGVETITIAKGNFKKFFDSLKNANKNLLNGISNFGKRKN